MKSRRKDLYIGIGMFVVALAFYAGSRLEPGPQPSGYLLAVAILNALIGTFRLVHAFLRQEQC